VVSPIGFVRSPCRDRGTMPGQGVTARIEVLPRYRAELIGVELSSHLIVVGWFHEARRPLRGSVATDRPAGIPPRGSFATRSPSRPNPLSLTVVRVSARTDLTLEVEGMDLVDGTAVLDLKPYIPGQDGVFSAIRSWRSRTILGPHRLLGYLEPELRNHLGDFADLPAARATLGAVLLANQRLGADPRDPALSARVNRADASADALMGLLGATLASGRVTIAPRRGPLNIRFTLGDRTLDLVQAGGRRDLGAEPGTWLERVPRGSPADEPVDAGPCG
jgi:tRNA-Thr(GGU) m(6)t(6)A37 methyltransferase TsaA